MRFVKCFVLVLCFCFFLSVPVFAEESVDDSSSDVSSAADSESPDSSPVESSDESIVDASSEDPVVSSLVDDSVSSYSTYALDDATFSYDSGTMAAVIVQVFGEYQPRTQTVTDHLSDGSSVSYEQIVPGVAGMDWHWISGVALFSLMLYSFLKLVGVLLKND